MDIQSLIEKYDDLFNEAWDRWETTQCALSQAEANKTFITGLYT